MPKGKRRRTEALPALPPVTAGVAFQLEELPAKRLKKSTSENKALVWTNLGVPEPIANALLELGYHTPTNIQREALPKAIEGRCDVLGVSETGSGKTLAYGLPLLRHIYEDVLQKSEVTESSEDEDDENDDAADSETVAPEGTESSEDEDDEDDEDDDASDSDPVAPEGIVIPEEEDGVIDLTAAVQAIEAGVVACPSGSGAVGVHSLVLTPTRELAMQVLGHLQAAAKHTKIRAVALVGGMSIQKQKRVLAQRKPHLVVATPGRLWALMSTSESEHLNSMRQTLRCLVIDEADRLVEQGHFAEVELILSALPKSTKVKGCDKPKPRQSMVFSATLTLPRNSKAAPSETLERLAAKACVVAKPKTIDVTGNNKKAQNLTEARLMCGSHETKDIYLYHFLCEFPGRTIIFCNSIDCVHRLCGLLTLLRLRPLRLHAGMQQRQRLKTLDRFTSTKQAVMVASDVAARGLDIKNVHHIIHYQVPRHPETYVHRSGRTARANKEGLSVVLVSPDDVSLYRRIIRELNGGQELTEFPLKMVDLDGPRRRVAAARLLDKEEHKQKMSKHNTDWFERQAQALDVVLDEDIKDFATAESQMYASGSHQKKMARLKSDLVMAFEDKKRKKKKHA